jgi:hypothetical protein
MTWQTIAAAVPMTATFGNLCAEIALDKPKEYLNFITPPLAIVLAMQEANKDTIEIFDMLMSQAIPSGVDMTVKEHHQAQAAEIYNYFAKKHTMRRIKDEYVSKYMLAVDELCDNRKRINTEHVKVLVSLPRIYEQNRALERVMKGRNSAKKVDTLSFAAWHGEVEFIERIHYKSKQINQYHYYFSTPTNYLMRVVVNANSYGQTAWTALSALGKLRIDAEVVYTYNVKGYDFNVLQFSPTDTSITPVN